jgi:predicted kinase
VLITGAPASGKSSLAARLALRYRAHSCSKDSIKEILFDTLGPGDPQWSRQLSDASFAVLFAFALPLCRADRPLLLEGNFRPGEHERPLTAVLSGGVQVGQILCQASHATRVARLAARTRDPRRHAGHHDERIGVQQAADAGYLQLPGPRLAFDSDAPREREFANLCAALDAWGLACINIDRIIDR